MTTFIRFPAKAVPILILSVVLMHSYPARSADLTGAQKTFLKKKKEIVFVSQTHYPPFEFIGEDGDHTGMTIELIRWIATEFGFKAHFTHTNFKQAQENIISGKADVLTSFFYSPQRDKTFDFTPTLFEVPAYIFVQYQRPDIKTLKDLTGKTVAIQKGDYANEFLENKQVTCNFIYTENFSQATDLVADGKADAIIGDEQIVLYHIFSHHMTEKIKRVGSPLYIGQNCMGLKEPGSTLLDIMNAGIDKAYKTGILDQIHKKWLGSTYSESPSRIQKLFPFVLIFLGTVSVLGFFAWVWNVRLRQKVADQTADLAKSEKTLRTILDASPMGIGLTDGRIVKWYNRSMGEMTGYDRTEMIGKNVEQIYTSSRYPTLRKKMGQKLTNLETDFIETKWVRKDGSKFDCRMRLAPLGMDGKKMNIAIAEDITSQKLSEKRIKASLKEKEMLLREIHHRVKNNMQVIASLLSLQEDKITPENALLAFKDSQYRIQSIALVHEILYQSDNLARIHLPTYLEALINNIQPIFDPSRSSLRIQNESDDIALEIDQAVPVGLIATELLTNAMKYGTEQGKPLEIYVAARLKSDSKIELEISDNGPGIDPGMDLEALDTLGLKLVKGLAEDQLEGGLHRVDTQGLGICWKVVWPLAC